ncbi:PAS domain-containing protein [Natronomonas gomsonensis]|uniref:PAS domain-containing protein n=1 Tax=Natronomonas gomsonensis TaxID=1046043 RepID=UPI00227B817A|nr:PAS domain-containing protein [Natronomonas gomsonensis]MCY4732616.1 PAS domain-containing protein [Natronomonas gomsonensis]
MAGSTVLSVTFLWALFSADFLDLTPITRRKLLDDVEDATIILDHRDRLAYSNQTAQELLDIRPEDAGMPADDVFAATAEEVRDQLVDMINDETEITLTSDGERRHFSASVSTVGDAGQSRVFVLHEITAQKEHELHIIQERDNLETLNQVLRHDLRNDLQLITAYADLLEDECETEDEQQYVKYPAHGGAGRPCLLRHC